MATKSRIVSGSFEQAFNEGITTWVWISEPIQVAEDFDMESIAFRLVKTKERKHGTIKKKSNRSLI
jgi:hypothetical protein